MCRVSATMSHEKACPTQVLILSTNSSTFCMAGNLRRVGGGGSLFCRACHISDGDQKNTIRGRRMVSLCDCVRCQACVSRYQRTTRSAYFFCDSTTSFHSGFSADFFLSTSSKTSSCFCSTESGVL